MFLQRDKSTSLPSNGWPHGPKEQQDRKIMPPTWNNSLYFGGWNPLGQSRLTINFPLQRSCTQGPMYDKFDNGVMELLHGVSSSNT